MKPLSQTSELHMIFMLPSVYVILARRLQQKSRLQTNEQCLVYSVYAEGSNQQPLFQFFYHTCKSLQTELFRLMQLQVTEFNLISV